MNTYKIQYSYNDGGERIRERDMYYTDTAQEAVNGCRNDHTGPLWDYDGIQIEYVWKLERGQFHCVTNWD